MYNKNVRSIKIGKGHEMKRVYKSLFLIAFLVLMLAILEFRVSLIIDIPMFLYVIVGTIILTFVYMKKGQDRYHLIVRIRINLLITGLIVMFLSQITSVATEMNYQYLVTIIINNFLPLFYAILLIFILDLLPYEVPNLDIERSIEEDRQELANLKLTKRERMVAQILFEELTNKEIGEELSITENTVKKHVHNIYEKAGVKNRTEFVHMYYLKERGE
ncbi:MAG: hypothetical protein CVV00_09260 [Firmicutes bacterium HGW-Firmicutes-5]|nr:MAG: hypothetical protein CVV00_09260 [Firmicutes bacterium HGW-Firmicutes-5]